MDWKKLHKDGKLTCEEGEEYLFAAPMTYQYSNGTTRTMWTFHVDAIVWDSETRPSWRDGDHGLEFEDFTHFCKFTPPEVG